MMEVDYSKIHWTGGRLNELNEKYKMNAAYKTVPVIKLIKAHQPRTWEELEYLIAAHQKPCKCGVRSKGTVKDFAINLYYAIHHEAPEYTKQDCLNFIVGLFIQSSMKGSVMEQLAVAQFKEYGAYLASDEVDRTCAVDVEIPGICGIQVKAEGYKYSRQAVKDLNKKKNELYDYPVYYLYYKDNEFTNIDDVKRRIG